MPIDVIHVEVRVMNRENRLCHIHMMIIVTLLILTPLWGFTEEGRSVQSGDTMADQKSNHPKSSMPNSGYSEDMSPEVSQHMDEINKVRQEPKATTGGSTADDTQSRGPMGEAAVGGSGPSGPSASPPGGAPGYEGDHPGSKR